MIVEFLEEDIPPAEISLPLDVAVVPCPKGHGMQPGQFSKGGSVG